MYFFLDFQDKKVSDARIKVFSIEYSSSVSAVWLEISLEETKTVFTEKIEV